MSGTDLFGQKKEPTGGVFHKTGGAEKVSAAVRKAPIAARPPAVIADDKPQRGRPSGYTPEIGEAICAQLATTKDGMEVIARRMGKNPQMVWRWLSEKPDFREMYVRAREFQTELMYDEIEKLAYAPLTHNGNPVDDPNDPGILLEGALAFAETNRRKMIIDVLKFKLAKLQPRRFGNNTTVDHTVTERKELNPEQFSKLLSTVTTAVRQSAVEDIDHEEL